MAELFRIGPCRIMVAPSFSDPISDWTDLGYFRGDVTGLLQQSGIARGRTDQTGPAPLADAIALAPGIASMRIPAVDHEALKVAKSLPGSVRVTSGTKAALTLPAAPATYTPMAVALVPELDLADVNNPNPFDSQFTVYFEKAILAIQEVNVGSSPEDTDDALKPFEITVTAVQGASGWGYPYMNSAITDPLGVLFSWQPSIDGLTPAVGEGAGTFTRATTGTYKDANGIIQTAGSGVHRIQGGGMLLEPQRTNYQDYSKVVSAGWAEFNVSNTVNAAVAPDGTATATKSTPTGTGATTYRSMSSHPTDGAVYTSSIFVKEGTSTQFHWAVYENAPAASFVCRVRFDWTDGVPIYHSVISGAVSGYSVNDFGNGWYRVSVSYTGGTTSTHAQYLYVDTIGATGTIYAWGAQVELGSYPASYIPTSGSAVTRNKDELVFPYTKVVGANGWTGMLNRTPKSSDPGDLWKVGLSAASAANNYSHRWQTTRHIFDGENGESSVVVPTDVPFTNNVRDDSIGSVNVTASTAQAYDGDDGSGGSIAVTITAADAPLGGIGANFGPPAMIVHEFLIVSKSLTPAQMRSYLRT